MAPRLIRRRPLAERIKSYLDPVDFVLWLSENVDSSEWEHWQKEWGTAIGIVVNVCFMVARANSGRTRHSANDDVFGDDIETIRWSSWFFSFIVHLLSLLSVINAIYTFTRRRHYRLFENPIQNTPSTPSAHPVKVNSSPMSSSPLRFLSSLLTKEDGVGTKTHLDSRRDVWEIAVWDPTPASLELFCCISPGHVLIYWLLLPIASTDPRPIMTVASTVAFATLLSIQLSLLRSNFSQQSKDASVIHKEVLNEYDTKFVHPRTQHLMRDVGTQFSSRKHRHSRSYTDDSEDGDADLYTPTFVINKGFHTRPNPSYVHHVDPQGRSQKQTASRATFTRTSTSVQTPSQLRDTSSPLQPQTAVRQPQFWPQPDGDGGSLGVFRHASSPLRKSASSNFVGPPGQRERSRSPQKHRGSPLKRNSLAALPNGYR